MPDPLSTLPWALAALAITLVAVLAAGRLAARLGIGAGPRQGRRLCVIETVPLDSRRRLLIVRCDETEFVLLVGGANDLVVCSLPNRQG